MKIKKSQKYKMTKKHSNIKQKRMHSQLEYYFLRKS